MDLSKIKARAQEKVRSANYVPTAKIINGVRNRFRLLEGWNPADREGSWYQDFGAHWIRGLDNEIKAVFVCQEKTFGQDCPVCNGLERAIAATHDDMALQRLTEAKSSARILVNVLEPDSDTPDKVKVLELPPSVVWGKSTSRGSPKVGGIFQLLEDWDLFDPNSGNDIIITRSGEGKLTSYSVGVAPKSKPVPKHIVDADGHIIGLHNLVEYATRESGETARKALTSVNSIVGLLPPPESVARIATAAKAAPVVNDVEDVASVDVVDQDEIAEIEESVTAVAESRAAAPTKSVAKAAAPAKPVVADPNDLEAYLKDL